MYKILLVFCLVLAVAKGSVKKSTAVKGQSSYGDRTDDYINLIRLQHKNNIKDFDIELERFNELFSMRKEAIHLQLEMLISSIVQVEQRLNPLEVLNEFTKHCVASNRYSIPTILQAKTAITNCILESNNQGTNLATNPLSIRNNLESYYNNRFENEIKNCKEKYDATTANYTMCVTLVAFTSNAYTVKNQKAFDTQLEAAECTAKANIKKALDCSYTVQTRITSKIIEADLLIDKCLDPKDKCEPCNTCQTLMEISEHDIKNHTILNPFYGRDQLGCLVLNVK